MTSFEYLPINGVGLYICLLALVCGICGACLYGFSVLPVFQISKSNKILSQKKIITTKLKKNA